ncbi:zinc-binding dehydrogenase [Bifidobacterium magnum]|uniref:Alcohol dehydrogenase n=1 Tax=Bifidobacterium magnum TaxID=1692 RepID=A0A087BBJ1_9BIFI|nr:zinc-binding dehydrogenase [Bifidobacterium magnum]KFI68391.1 Alcohol dehydrogenase [Bifidobacterium magnum]
MDMMKAYVVPDEGATSIDDVRLMEVAKPAARPGEVLVKVKAVGLNPVDYKLVAGHNAAWAYPHILGLDMAGVIEETGEGVEQWKVGMRVAGHLNLAKDGCFAQYVSVPTYELAEIPEPVTFEEAASLLCGALTAYQTVDRKPNLNNVQTVLVQGGSGSVGALAIQFAHLHGLTVYTTVSTRSLDFVGKLHPEAVIDYTKEDVAARVAELTNGHGVDLIIDTVSGASAQADFEMLAYNGQLVTIVGVPTPDPSRMFANAWSMDVVNLGGAHESGNPEQKRDLGQMATEVLMLMANKEIDPMIGSVMPFDRLLEGLHELQDHRSLGKIVVTVE